MLHPYRSSTWGDGGWQDCEFRASLDYRMRPVYPITSNGLVSTWEDVSKCYARCTGSIRSRLLTRGLPLILLVEVEDINLETTFSVGPDTEETEASHSGGSQWVSQSADCEYCFFAFIDIQINNISIFPE